MRIAFLHPQDPHVAGGGADVRARMLAAGLAQAGTVDVVHIGAPDDIPVDVRWLPRVRAAAGGVPPRLSQRYDPGARAAVAARVAAADVVIASTVFAMPYVAVQDRARTVLDAHNVERDVVAQMARRHPAAARRFGYRLTAAWTGRYESGLARQVGTVWAVSDPEAQWFRAAGAADVRLIPNGVTVRPRQPRSNAPVVLFVGSMDALFNRDGIAWFVDAVWPQVRAVRPDARLLLVGQGGDQFGGEGVEALGFVADVDRAYADARVAVAPLLSGGGTRLKVLEAAANGVPVVATTIGAAGLDVRDSVHCLITDDASAFATNVATLLDNDDVAGRLADAAYQLVADRYEWSVVSALAAASLRDLFARRH